MKLSDFAKLLGLSEDATEEQVKEKVKALSEASTKKDDDKGKGGDSLPSDLKALAERNPGVADLIKRLDETDTKLRLADITNEVRALHEHARTKGVAIPASIDEDLTKVLHEAGPTVGAKFVGILKSLSEKGFVKLGEIGHAGQSEGEGQDPRDSFNNKVKKFQDDNKGTPYVDAVMAVALTDPEGYKAYAHASYTEIRS
jgi:hypothetical protein